MNEAIEIALEIIKKWEGCRLEAYPDPATGGAPWTIGWGATGPSIGPGTVWTQEEADVTLHKHVRLFAGYVDKMLHGIDLTPNQLAALISLCYNIGPGNLEQSTLLRKIKAGDYDGAADQFLRWNRAGGRVMQGLTNRREHERAVFLGIEQS